MHRFRRYDIQPVLGILAVAAVIAFVFLALKTLSAAVSDYEYVVTVAIDNQGGALDDTPVAITMNPSALISQSFLQGDAEDWFPVDVSQAELQGVAQGMGTTSAPWWVDITQAAGSMSLYSFYMGDSTATRDQRFRFDGTTDTLTVTDHADLDITDDLLIEATIELVVWPTATGTAYVIRKEGAYEIEVGLVGVAESITGTVTSAGDSQSVATVLDDESAALEAGVEYDVALYYDKDAASENLKIYINDVEVNAEDFTDSLASTATDVVIGSGLNGYIDALRIDPAILYESYEETDSIDEYAFGNTVWESQTFTPSLNHSITYVELYGRRVSGTPTDLIVSIKATTGGKPTGANLASVTIDPSAWDTSHAWHTATFDTPTTLVASTKYAIVLRYTGTSLLTWKNKDPGNYADGDAYESTDSGSSWGAAIGDFVFREYGEATDKVSFDFEPDEIESTQVGNSGNSWVWTGTVEDVSTGGSDHDGTYSLTRDLSDVRVWLYSLEATEAPTIDPTPTPIDSMGAITLTPVATPDEIDFLFREQLVDVLEHADIGIIPMAAWFVFLTGLGLVLSVGVWAATKSAFLVAIPLPVAYWIGYALGTPIPLWLPLVFTFVSIGAAYGLSKITE